jgi:hypothetical protein
MTPPDIANGTSSNERVIWAHRDPTEHLRARVCDTCMCGAHCGGDCPRPSPPGRRGKTGALFEFLTNRVCASRSARAFAAHGQGTAMDGYQSPAKHNRGQRAVTTNRSHLHYCRFCVRHVTVRSKRHPSCNARSYGAPMPPMCRFATALLHLKSDSRTIIAKAIPARRRQCGRRQGAASCHMYTACSSWQSLAETRTLSADSSNSRFF